MARREVVVKATKDNGNRLPGWATEYAVIVERLRAHGVLDEVGRKLRVSRRPGFVGIDIVLFFLLFFTGGQRRGGIKGFWSSCREYWPQFAAVGGRSSFPSSSAVSRYLSAVEDGDLNELGRWLLCDAVGDEALGGHATVVSRDTLGGSWHFFDWDPKVTTLRQRALPEGEDLPAPRRRSSEASGGYPGRKRGDVQFSRATLQHAGSSQWIGIWTAPGNGRSRIEIRAAVERVRHWCERSSVPVDRAVLRSDGSAGNGVPGMWACMEMGVRYLTRLARYEILKWPQVQEKLAASKWEYVADSRSGPRRQATELGTIRLSASPRTLRDDGQPFEPIEARVVVSRYRAAGKRGAGIVIDGWHYELYATDLEPAAWPASEIVTAYYGRCGQENRFAQENRELELDRIFSYHLLGQHLATLLGLFVWNLRVFLGSELIDPLPEEAPPQEPRSIEAAESNSASGHEPEVPSRETAQEEPLKLSSAASPGCETRKTAETAEERKQAEPVEATAEASPASPGQALSAQEAADRHTSVLSFLDRLDWEHRLENRPGWNWGGADAGLLCPEGAAMRVHKVQMLRYEAMGIDFRAQHGACGACNRRDQCSTSTSSHFKKEVRIHVFPNELEGSEGIRKYLLNPKRRRRRLRRPKPETRNPKRDQQKAWRPTPGENNPGPLEASWPILVPSELRKRCLELCNGVDTIVELSLPPPRVLRPKHLAYTPSQRQQRRMGWDERAARYALPHDAAVSIEFRGERRLEGLLRAKESNATHLTGAS